MRLISFAVENHKNFKEKQGMFFTPEEGEGRTRLLVFTDLTVGVKLIS